MNSISISELLNDQRILNIIDIRSIEKYNDNHIPRAINIPKTKLINNPEKYLNFKEVYYIYCKQGIESIKVSNLLRKMGYRTINIIGGYEAWLLENSFEEKKERKI